jgi:hypothetical protein
MFNKPLTKLFQSVDKAKGLSRPCQCFGKALTGPCQLSVYPQLMVS